MRQPGFLNEDIFSNSSSFSIDPENDWKAHVQTRNGYQIIPQTYKSRVRIFSDEQKQRFLDSTKAEGVLIEGFDEIPAGKKEMPLDEMGVFDRIGKDWTSRAQTLRTRWEDRKANIDGSSVNATVGALGTIADVGNQFIGGLGSTIGSLVGGTVGWVGDNVPLLGSTIKAIGDIPKNVVEANPETIGKAVGALSEILNELETYKAQNPNAASGIETIQTLAELFGAKAVSGIGKTVVKGAAEGLETGVKSLKKVDVPMYAENGVVNPEFQGIVRAFNVEGDNPKIISKRVNDIATAIERGDIDLNDILGKSVSGNPADVGSVLSQKVVELSDAKRSMIPSAKVDITKSKSLRTAIDAIVREADAFLKSKNGVDEGLYFKAKDLNGMLRQLKSGNVSVSDLSEFSTKFKTQVNDEIFSKKGTEKAGSLADLNPSFERVDKFTTSKVPKKSRAEYDDLTSRISGVINARKGIESGTVGAVGELRKATGGDGIITRLANAWTMIRNPSNMISSMGGSGPVDRSMIKRVEDAQKLLEKSGKSSGQKSKLKEAGKKAVKAARIGAATQIVGSTTGVSEVPPEQQEQK